MFRRIPKLVLPPGIVVIDGPKGLRFQGTATALLRLCDETLARLRYAPDGSRFVVGDWIMGIFEHQPLLDSPKLIAMPRTAWGIVSAKFAEVATGWEETPFDFSDCGYLWPPPDPDIGVELVGAPLL